MSFLLGLLPGRLWLIGGAVALVLGAFATQSIRIHLWQHDYAEKARELQSEKADRAIEAKKATDAAIAATSKFRSLEQEYQRTKEEAEHARLADQAANARVIAGLTSQLRGVRDELAAYASGSREPTGDSLEACQRRARALGDVLGEALRVQDELAGDAETEAANARSVLAAWPVTP